MKKNFLLLISLIFLVLLAGCSNRKTNDINYRDDPENEILFEDYTYKFIGSSEHFFFETGKVYYGENVNVILISNFGLNESMSNKTTYIINLYFNDRLLVGDIENNGIGLYNEEQLSKTVINEKTEINKDEKGNFIGEFDAFTMTTKDTFKDSIKVEVKYCNDGTCRAEKMNIKIVEEKK